MAVNKVERADGTVEIDISDTTAEPEDVSEGEVFYKGDGTRGVGTGKWMKPVTDPVAGEILITDANGQAQSSGTDLDTLLFDVEAGKEAFALKDFNQQINLTLPSVTQDIANTSIPNMDIDLNVIDPTGELNTKYAIAGIAKYEIYDAESGGNDPERIWFRRVR